MSEADGPNYRDDPDAWLVIPGFHIKPSDVNYSGFSIPVFSPNVDCDVTENLISIIGSARKLAMRSFKNLATLDFFNVIALKKFEGGHPLVECEKSAIFYSLIMGNLEQFISPKTSPQLKVEELSFVASHLATWAVDGVSAAHEKMCKRNANIAALPRPNARGVDHEDVQNEYRRLVREGHTEREARGILVSRGNMGSQSTIHRVTKKK